MPQRTKNNRTVRLHPQKGDALAVVFVLLLAAVSFLGVRTALAAPADRVVAVVTMNGEELQRIDLSAVEEARDIPIEGAYSQTLRVEPGRICMLCSDCPNNNCVYMGWASDPTHIIVCLPNRVEVTILGEGGADAAAR